MLCIYNAYQKFKMEAQGTVPKSKEKKDSGNKDSQLILRLDKSERDEFVALCKEMDTSAAREIRHFIRAYIKKHK